MKTTHKIIALALVGLTAKSSLAYPIVKYSRTKDRCGIGCATVKQEKDMVDITTADGKAGKGWIVNIQCFGAGWTHCPHRIENGISDSQVEIWSENIFGNLSEYAQNQINNGVSSGQEIFNYSLSDGTSRTLKLSWDVELNGTTEQKSNITINQI